MELLSILQAHSMKVFRMVGGNFGYIPDAIRALVAQYKFVGFPTRPEEILPADASSALTFRQGKCELPNKEILIDVLQVFGAGLLAGSRTGTADSDLILDTVFNWARTTFGCEFEFIKPGFAHNSQLEIRLKKPLPELFPTLAPIGNSISGRLDDFFGVKPTYELMTLNFGFDKTRFPSTSPAFVRLDRRAGSPFEQEVYWSEAPLSTADHFAVLSEFEELALASLK